MTSPQPLKMVQDLLGLAKIIDWNRMFSSEKDVAHMDHLLKEHSEKVKELQMKDLETKGKD